MRIHTRTVWSWDGKVLEDETFEYSGPVARCDRSQQAFGRQSERQTMGTAGQFGAESAGTYGILAPLATQWATGAAPGYGAVPLSGMLTEAGLGAAGRTAAAEESARLRAMRSGNVAGLSATEAAMNEAGSRTAAAARLGILSQDAKLRAQQQMEGMRELSNLYGGASRAEVASLGILPRDIEATSEAGRSGWFQNMLGLINTLGPTALPGIGRGR